MKGRSPKLENKTWKRLMVLCQKQGPVSLKCLSQELKLGELETLELIRHAFPNGVGATVLEQNNETWINFDTKGLQYVLPLTPEEWVELQRLLITTRKNSSIIESLKKRVIEASPVKVEKELFEQLEIWDQEMSDSHKKMVETLDSAISEMQMVQLSFEEGKTSTVYPCKVLHLEGELALIAEESHEHCLSIISLKNVSDIRTVKTDGFQKMTIFEIEEFIGALRSMNEKETRLILKIHDPESVNLFPDHHFLGKPCMITNANGDLIWSAYVEPCGDLFDWLEALGKNVEILDPIKFKQEYLSYCEEKIRKIA